MRRPLRRVLGGIASMIGRHDEIGVVAIKRVGLERIPDSPDEIVVLSQRLVVMEDAVVLSGLALNAGVKVRFLVGIAQMDDQQPRVPLGNLARSSSENVSMSVREFA